MPADPPAALRLSGTSAAVIESIFDMHFPTARRVLDLTFGRGVFWRWPHAFELDSNDRDPASTARLHLDVLTAAFEGSWDVVVFDPPFTANGPQKTTADRHQDRFGSTRDLPGAPQNIGDVHRLLIGGVKVACGLARLGVIVKTQDVIESGRYRDSETLACQAIVDAGLRVEDKVRLLAGRRVQPDVARGSRIRHFRNRPSVFIVGKP